MRFSSLFCAAGLARLASASNCQPHKCRQLISQAPHGIDDCNAFLLTTYYLPTQTDSITPSSVVTKTHTKTISETDTSSYTESYQPSVVIWSTYTSIDVVNSVTHTTTRQITTTTTTRFTNTKTTALATTTTTTTTATTKPVYNKRSAVADVGADTTVVTPSVTPRYAASCYSVARYVSNCLALGATRSTSIVTPAIDSETISSTSISTASGDTSVYVSTTITQTTTTTLPSLRSTTTLPTTRTTVVSTSTSTTYTKTSTKTSTGITTATLATTTTTTTKTTASPTPYIAKVTGQGSGSPNEVGYYLDWLTVANWPALANSFTYGSYVLGFISGSTNGDNFVVNPDGRVATIITTTQAGKVVNTQYYLTVVSGYVVPNASPADGADIVTCTYVTGTTVSLSGCNYYLYATTWGTGGNSLNIVGASASTGHSAQIALQLTSSKY